ncbi:uncharacterized protein LALA0_S03e08460g [Lachancea lanzarotensis]|uniref:LALA0S03e08460g1_1 n=1 Tax=Lachancea lanzarotensis TaxID=1245769 RepID=A0A0C7MVT2_9SACH|nr:uncharacterized protein LALA0_S03e08460g [Lachancea lanzarotensis]CEP61683.1 LALA0S03e08460g1_1 [Lachancea lanzarotensis]
MLRDRRKVDNGSSVRVGPEIQDEDDDDCFARTQFTNGDIFRMIGGILILGLLAGRLITGSVTWNIWRRSISQVDLVKPSAYWVGQDLPRAFSVNQLQQFDGSNLNLPILLAIRGQVFDVSRKSGLYGPRGPYHRLVGADCSKSFSHPTWSMQAFREPCSNDLTGLSDEGLQRVVKWVDFFQNRYPHIGYVTDSKPLLA